MQVPLRSAMSGDELLFDLEEEPGEEQEGASLHSSSSPASPLWDLGRGTRSTPSDPSTPQLGRSEAQRPAFTVGTQAPALAVSHTGGLHHRAASHFKKRHYR